MTRDELELLWKGRAAEVYSPLTGSLEERYAEQLAASPMLRELLPHIAMHLREQAEDAFVRGASFEHRRSKDGEV